MELKKCLKRAAVIMIAAAMIQPAMPTMYANTVFAENEEQPSLVISQTEGKEGNIFFDEEAISLKVLLKNESNSELNSDITYSVVNYRGEECYKGNISDMSLAKGEEKVYTIDIPTLPYDTYTLNIGDSKISFSRVKAVEAKQADNIFGVCTHFAQKKGGDPNINLDMIKKTGTTWIRDDFSWGGIEKEQGVYSFEEKDEFVDKILAHDMNILAILDYGCKFYDEGVAPYSDEGIEAYAKFCGAVAKNYIGKIEHFEIWNEYNGGMGNPKRQPPEVYAKMLKAAYIAIKEANPNATVVGCSTSCVDIGWIERVLKAVGPDYMDAVSIHPYGFPASPESAGLEDNMKNVHALLERYGKDMPVWSTEYGYPTYKEGVNEELGAAYLARSYMVINSVKQDDKIFWYDFQNDTPASDTNREANFGLIKHETDFYAAKQTLLAYTNVIDMMQEREFDKIIRPNDNIVIYKYKGSEDMLALWSLEKEENLSLKVDAPSLKVIDFLGNEEVIYTQNGNVTLSVGKYPIYLEGKFDEVETSAAIADSIGGEINVVAGESFELTLSRDEKFANLEYALKPELPNGFECAIKPEFKAGQTEVKIPVKVFDDVSNNSYQLKFRMEADGKCYGESNITVNVVAGKDVKIFPVILDTKNWDSWAIDIKIKNNSGISTCKGRVTITEPAEFADKYKDIEFEELSYGEEAVIRVPVETKPDNKLIPMKLKIEYNDGTVSEIQRNISCLAAVKTKTPITVDGVFTEEEWGDAMSYDFADRSKLNGDKGEEDLSAKGAIMWDRKNLYFGVVINDDIHFQDQDGSGMWMADGLQVVMDPGRINGAGSMDWHEIGYGLKDMQEVGIWRWLSIPGKPGGTITNIDAKIVRDEDAKTTTYEMAVPWEELLPVGMTMDTGDLFGFSILANESDGDGRRGWINYMGGIADDKKPERFGDVILIDLDEEEAPEQYKWAEGAVKTLWEKKIIETNVRTYPYGGNTKIGEFVDMLIKCMNKDTSDTWTAAKDMGVITEEQFNSGKDEILKRQDMMVITNKILFDGENKGQLSEINVFNDAASIADYARQSIANLVHDGIINGDGENLNPNNNTINAEAAAVLGKITK